MPSREYYLKNKDKYKENSKKYYAKNKDKIKKNHKVNYLKNKDRINEVRIKNKYDITPQQLDNLYAEQNDSCKICNTHKDENITHKGVLCIDHSHDNYEIRGLLCGKCNTAIGLLNDDPEILTKAVEYLKTKGKFN